MTGRGPLALNQLTEAEHAEHTDWLVSVLRHHEALTPEDHRALDVMRGRLDGHRPLSLEQARYLWALYCSTEIDIGF